MRLIHLADIHLERSFAWLGPDRGRARRSTLRTTLRRAVDLTHEHNADALCIAGDLFDRETAGPNVGEFLRTTFATLGDRPVLIAPGNHDFFSPGCLYDQVNWPANVHVFRSRAPSPIAIGDGTVWGTAFTGPEWNASPLAGFVSPRTGLNVGLLHAEIVDARATSNFAPLLPAEIAASGLRFAMLGHVHAGRTDQAQRFAYPGSLEPLAISEVGPRAALLVDVTSENVRVESISVAQQRVIEDEIDLTPFSTIADLQRYILQREVSWEHADVRLRLVGALNGELQDSELVRGVFRNYDVALDVRAVPELDVATLAEQRTVLGVFVRDLLQRSAATTEESQKQFWSDVLQVGVAAFRGRQVTL